MRNLKLYFDYAREREAMRLRRLAGGPAPWTDDPVLSQWRFCNVHREDDKTTAWFREHVRSKVDGWRAVQATLAFRWFNRIEVGEKIEDLLVDGWNRKEAKRRLKGVTPVTNAAYMVHTPRGMDKLDGVLKCIDLVTPHLDKMSSTWGDSLEEAWRDLVSLPNVGRFVAYEAVSDLRWTPVLAGAKDIMTWASAGPGCARGLGWVSLDDHRAFNYGSTRDQQWMLYVMRGLLEFSQDEAYWPSEHKPWEMREVEHWLCEIWKVQNALKGNRLKRRYEHAKE